MNFQKMGTFFWLNRYIGSSCQFAKCENNNLGANGEPVERTDVMNTLEPIWMNNSTCKTCNRNVSKSSV